MIARDEHRLTRQGCQSLRTLGRRQSVRRLITEIEEVAYHSKEVRLVPPDSGVEVRVEVGTLVEVGNS